MDTKPVRDQGYPSLNRINQLMWRTYACKKWVHKNKHISWIEDFDQWYDRELRALLQQFNVLRKLNKSLNNRAAIELGPRRQGELGL